MSKLNKKIILLSFAITTLLLFGGWFTIQFFGTEKPIMDYLAQHETIEIIDLKIEHGNLDLEIRFIDEPEFAVHYVEVSQYLQQLRGLRHVQITIDPEQSEHHPWWLTHSASILEHLHAKKYTQIEKTINSWQSSGIVSAGTLAMNSNYLYIYLEPVGYEPVYLLFPVLVEKGVILND